MNSLIKLTVAALAIATLAGCAAPLPKGSDSSKYLPLPVNTANMKPVEMKLKAKNGDEYDALRFNDVANNKWYDSDGYPVNDKFLRVLKTGEVCESTKRALIGNGPKGFTINNDTDVELCIEKMDREKADKAAYVFSAGGLVAITGLGGAAMAGATAAGAAGAVAVEEVKQAIKSNEE